MCNVGEKNFIKSVLDGKKLLNAHSRMLMKMKITSALCEQNKLHFPV